MIGRRVRSAWHRLEGVVDAWEPLGAGLCDARVREPSGRRVWVSSRDLEPLDGGGPLPSRAGAQEEADRSTLAALRVIRAALVAECRPPGRRWFGCEFGKGMLGQSIDAAIEEVSGRISGDSSSPAGGR